MAKIIGNTTATPNPRSDWAQTDSTKADFIKNKPTVLTEDQIKQLIDEYGGGSGGGFDASELNERISELEFQIAELSYVPIEITSFTHNAGTKEIGSTVTSMMLSWQTNKTPTSLTLDGVEIGTNETSKMIDGLSITHTNNKTWKLVATDEKKSVEKTVSITFCTGVYYGVGTQEHGFDGTVINGLTKKLQTTKSCNFTVNPMEQYIYYVVPVRLGTVSFKVGGFEGGFAAPETVSITNDYGYTEDCYVYRSTNKITGSTTVDAI